MAILLSYKGKKNTGTHFPKQHTEVIPSQDHCYSSHPSLQLTLEKSECFLAVGAIELCSPGMAHPKLLSLFSIFASFSWWWLPLSSVTSTFCCHTELECTQLCTVLCLSILLSQFRFLHVSVNCESSVSPCLQLFSEQLLLTSNPPS